MSCEINLEFIIERQWNQRMCLYADMKIFEAYLLLILLSTNQRSFRKFNTDAVFPRNILRVFDYKNVMSFMLK